MLREPLGDPQLRLQFLDRATESDAERRAVEAGPGRELTVVQRDGTPAVAIDHDAQLNDDPELLNAAGAVALLAAENAQLDAGWTQRAAGAPSVTRAPRQSRRRRTPQGRTNLHDGVQQRLIGSGSSSRSRASRPPTDPRRATSCDEIGDSVEEALDELRDVAHGLYPPVLGRLGPRRRAETHPSPRRRLAHRRRRRRRPPSAGSRVRGLLLLPARRSRTRASTADRPSGSPSRSANTPTN